MNWYNINKKQPKNGTWVLVHSKQSFYGGHVFLAYYFNDSLTDNKPHFVDRDFEGNLDEFQIDKWSDYDISK